MVRVVQLCILLIPFAGALSVAMFFILGLTFAGLMIRETYVAPPERLEYEVITTFVTPTLNVHISLHRFQVDNVYGGLALVASGIGVALLPTAAAEMRREGVVFRQLEGRLPKMESVIVLQTVVRQRQ